MEILTFTKDDNDIDGLVWVSSLIKKPKSDLLKYTRIQITSAAEGSIVVACDGSMLFKYETRDQIKEGYYEVLKVSGSVVVLHKDCDIGVDWMEDFTAWEGTFGTGIPVWSGAVSCLDKILVSKSYSDTVRNLLPECSLVFEMFVKALGGPGVTTASIYKVDEARKTAVELEGGRCRAKVMTTWDSTSQ